MKAILKNPTKCSKILEKKYILDNIFYNLLFPFSRVNQRHKSIRTNKIKLGIVGRFSGLLAFNSSYFKNVPDDIELYLYDISYHGQYCEEYSIIGNYKKFSFPRGIFDKNGFLTITNTIDHDNLDACILVNDGKHYPWLLVNLLKTPNLISLNTGSFPLFNKKCILQIYDQVHCGYKVTDNKLSNIFTNKTIEPFIFGQKIYMYDTRNLQNIHRIKDEKKNIMIYTGSLFKINKKIYLNIISEILDTVENSYFYFYGKNDFGGLEGVQTHFKKRNQIDKIKYCGVYSSVRNNSGDVENESWNKALKVIQKAKVFVDAFPDYGGSSVIEAYALNIPVISIVDNDCEFKESYIKCIETKSGTSINIDDYKNKVIRVLRNENIAYEILEEQNKIIKEILDFDLFYNNIKKLIHLNNFDR